MPLIVPVYVEGEATTIECGSLVAVLAGGVRVEGLTIAYVVGYLADPDVARVIVTDGVGRGA